MTQVPPPDLQVTAVSVPDTGVAGQSVELGWTVANTGGGVTKETFWADAIYLSRDQVFDGADVRIGVIDHTTALGGYSSYTGNLSVSLPSGISGPYYVFVNADCGYHVVEQSDANNMSCSQTAIYVSLPSCADLAVISVTAPGSVVCGQSASVGWVIENTSSNVAVGKWTDSIYLSSDDAWDVEDTLIGKLEHTGPLNGSGSYTGSLSNTIPGVKPGNYYVIVRSDIKNEIGESDEANNTTASSTAIQVGMTALEIGVPHSSQLDTGTSDYYQLEYSTSGEAIVINLDSQSSTDCNELYVRFGEVPSRSAYDYRFSKSFAADQQVTIPSSQIGTYYILGYGDSIPAGPTTYTIQADLSTFGLHSVSPNPIGNQGTATVAVLGTALTETTVYELLDAQESVIRTADPADGAVFLKDASTAYPTFNTDGLPAGNYFIRALDGTNMSDYLPLSIVDGGGDFQGFVETPPSAAPNQTFGIVIHYTNNGVADVPVPLIMVRSRSGNTLVLPGPNGVDSVSNMLLLGFASEAPSGILMPGASGKIVLETSATTPEAQIDVEYIFPTDEDFDWDLVYAQRDDAEWHQAVDAARLRLGEHWNDVVSDICKCASFSGSGTSAVSFDQWFDWEMYVSEELTSAVQGQAACAIVSGATTITLNGLNSVQALDDRSIYVNSFDARPIVPSLPTSVLTHGWNDTGDSQWIKDMARDLYNDNPNQNILIVDWNDYSGQHLPMYASVYCSTVGVDVARYLLERGVNPKNLDFYGHSMGCYVGPALARYLDGIHNIYACDPAAEWTTVAVEKDFTKNTDGAIAFYSSKCGNHDAKVDKICYVDGPWNMGQRDKHHLSHEIADFGIKEHKSYGNHWVNTRKDNEPRQQCRIDLYGNEYDESNVGGDYYHKPIVDSRGPISSDPFSTFYRGIPTVLARDPNDKIGPNGFGEQGFVGAHQTLPYTVRFENMSTATAPAQHIYITDMLDSDLDARTFRLGTIVFGNYTIAVPDNKSYYQTCITLGPDCGNIKAEISAGVDIQTGMVHWSLTAIDPATGDIPQDPMKGLLPPNDENHSGEGYVTFTIRPLAERSTGTLLTNTATIAFDTNSAMTTNTVSNTMDSGAPVSSVNTLPAQSDQTTFTVSWSGNDDTGGSGISSYDVYVSDNDRAYTKWQSGVTTTSAVFTGSVGHTYRFYSVARDNVGNLENAPNSQDTSTRAGGDLIYVKTTGDDLNDGYSWATAKSTVQAAINAATDGMGIRVAAGTYEENITLKDGLGLYGGYSTANDSSRNISQYVTVLDGGEDGSVVTVPADAGSDTVLDGFVITNGTGTSGYGGGVYCSEGAFPTISHNQITENNVANCGGGIFIDSDAGLMIMCNVIEHNDALSGAGVYCDPLGSSAMIVCSIIASNTATNANGGGVECSGTEQIINNTIVGNSGGVSIGSSQVTVGNCIIVSNTSTGVCAVNCSPTLSHNDVYGNLGANYSGTSAGSTDISVDPSFVDLVSPDYHLMSSSVCIDAGDDSLVGIDWYDLDGLIRNVGSHVDVGAYEYNPE